MPTLLHVNTYPNMRRNPFFDSRVRTFCHTQDLAAVEKRPRQIRISLCMTYNYEDRMEDLSKFQSMVLVNR